MLVAPYLVNDFANIHVRGSLAWLACDHGSRLVSLAALAWLVRRRVIDRDDLLMRGGPAGRTIAITLAATIGGLALDAGTVKGWLDGIGWGQLGVIPGLEPKWLAQADWVLGLAFVAVSEELIFRGALPRLLGRSGLAPGAALGVAAAVFGLVHWSLGFGHVVQAALIGVWFGVAVRLAGSLWPVMLAHYVVNLVAFR